MTSAPQLPDFVSTEWYRDPRDHRCPHDGWLESLEITEPATGARHEIRGTEIRIRLLGAYHDGYIVFRYSGVQSYSLAAPSCGSGLGDWLEDEFVLNASGLLVHRIHWLGHGPDRKSTWTIEAKEVTYEWIPKS